MEELKHNFEDYDRIQRRLFSEARRATDMRERAISDLMRESRDNPIVRSYLDAWMAGRYENLEMALFALAAHLSKENQFLRSHVLEIARFAPSENSIIFRDSE